MFSLSAKARRTGEQPISRLMYEAVTRPEVISLAAGLVDHESLPTDAVRECIETVLAADASGRAALQYGTTPGLAELREAMLAHLEGLDGLTRDDWRVTPDHVVVTTGSQQGLYLVTDALVDPGDIVITSAPSYFVYTHALASFGADVRTVPMDAGGMCVDALETLLAMLAATGELDRLKLIYCVSYFQNPTGISLAADRRARLVEMVQRYSRSHRIALVEDAAYRELRYDGADAPSLKSFDRDNDFVVLAATFSKPFSPGLKTGVLVLPDGLVAPVLWQKGNHDFGSQNFVQHVLLEALRSGAYERHVAQLRETYAAKRDVMLAALEAHLGELPQVSWVRPGGGLYVWLTLPRGQDAGPDSALWQRCLDEGVMYVPGVYCYSPGEDGAAPTNEIRLSFGVASTEQITEGIRRLGVALGALAGERRQADPGARSVASS